MKVMVEWPNYASITRDANFQAFFFFVQGFHGANGIYATVVHTITGAVYTR